MTSRHLVKSIGFVLAVAAVVAFSSPGLRGAKKDRRAHLSADLTRHQARKTTARQRVIVHGTRPELDLLASRHRLYVVKRMRGAAVVLVNSAELGDLSRDVDQLSGDLRVQSSTVISDASTAADQTRAGNALLLGLLGIPGVDGQGIGIAVVDSGIAPHSALGNRVVANVSFVSNDPQMTDAYGHGTHVAGIIAGSRAVATSVTPEYAGGIAPRARLVNVRVLGADGTGFTSDVIDGIEWVVANRALYNIRVINLSLGHPVMEACATDPLCQAVNHAVRGGDRRGRRRRQRRRNTGRPHRPRGHFVAGQLALCDHGRRVEHAGNGRSIGRHPVGVQLSRSFGVRPRGEA